MKKFIIIIVVLYFIILGFMVFLLPDVANADEYWRDTEGKLSKEFSMCQCVNEAREVFPNLRDDQLEYKCEELYIDYLMKKSEKTGSIVIGNYTSCVEE